LFKQSKVALRLSQGLLALKFARGKAIDKARGERAGESEANAVKQ